MPEFKAFIDEISKAVLSFDFLSDLVDVAFVAFLIYQVIKLLRGTRAFQIIKAICIVAVVYMLVSLFNMEASEYIFRIVFDNAIIIFMILFSPELRQVLENVGRRSIRQIPLFSSRQEAQYNVVLRSTINDVCKAVSSMSRKKCGALIVFENKTPLREIIETGTVIDAVSSPELINSLFFKNSALHDGALIIRDGKIYSAGCILPLTENDLPQSDLGTRHRAALGMSENSDAAVVVVSEETGAISLACSGNLRRDISTGDVREFLIDYLVENDIKSEKSAKFFKSKKKSKDNDNQK